MSKDFKVMIDDKALNDQISRALKRNPKETAKTVRECVLDLAARSAKIAPIETGDLRNDCTATLNGLTVFKKQTPLNIASSALSSIGEVSYGLPYALRQHEDLTLSHDRSDGYDRPDGTSVNKIPGGEAKFLEKPFNANKEKYTRKIQEIPEEILK